MPKTCPTCDTTYPDSLTFCPKDGSGLRAVDARDDLIGEVIAERYLVTDLLGQGGMGMVYLAQHVRIPQQAAIKLLKTTRGADPAQGARFRQEAEAASRIAHDRVARVYDFGTTANGDPYIAMEYVPGRTLRSMLDERGALDPGEAAQILYMIAEGLDAAHRIGILHRDLKPENIMIVEEPGGALRVKVLDFGIARIAGTSDRNALTQVGFIIGSPAFMSPEQVRGGALDARSDVYALGLLAFVSLTGRMPFSGETLEAEMHSRLIDAPTSLSQVASQVAWPSALQQLFDRTFDRDVEQRPAGALAFARELYDIVTQWTGATAPPGLIAPSAMATVPNPSAAPLSSATQALSTASSGVAPHADASWRAAKSRADATEARANGGGRLALYVTLGTVVVAIAAGAYQWSARSSGAPSGLAGGGDSASSTVTTAPAASPASPASVAPGSNAADSSAMATRGAPPATPSGTSAPSATAKPPGAGSAGASSNAGSNAGSSAGSNAGSSAGSSANAKSAHDELRALMNRFDRDGSATVARDVVSTLETLRPRLEASLDQAWADFYLGMSLATLGDNAKACTALERAQSLGENSVVRTESLEWRVRLRCQPDGQQ